MRLLGNYQRIGDAELPTYDEGESQASRVSSKEMIQALSKAIPSLGLVLPIYPAQTNTMVTADKDFTPRTL